MHTSAQRIRNPLPGADLFGEDEDHDTAPGTGLVLAAEPAQAGETVVCTGTLTRHAEVRVKPVGPHGDPVTVVCIDLEDVTPLAQAVHVERVYPNDQRPKAEAFAAQLRKGMRITAHCPMQDTRLSLTNTQHIEFQPPLQTGKP